MRWCLGVACAALCGATAAPLPAQRYWDRSFAPYAYYSAVDGVWLAWIARLYSPIIGFEPRPEPHYAWIALTAGASTEGSSFAQVDLQAPAYWDAWRLGLTVALRRDNRLGYYGTGNDTGFSDDSVTPGRPYFYRVSRTARSARATVQRRLAGPLRILAGLTVEHTRFRGLPGETVFERDRAAGLVGPVPFSDVALRGGMVLDTRDHEVDPHRGVLLEALYADGRGYTRTTVAAQLYVRPVEKLVLAARLGGERMERAPLAAQRNMESSEQPFLAVGGYRSLRGYHDGRFTGPGKLIGGLEVRYALLFAPPYELKLVGFYDAGRVFGAADEFRLTTDGLHASGGGELAARLGRNTLLVVGAGFGSEGWRFLFETRWSY